MAAPVTTRKDVLDEAGRIIAGDRDAQYGSPEDNFGRIAKLWSVIFEKDITSEEVALAMVALKIARYVNKSGAQPDTWVDIAGYAACGGEVEALKA